jgi:hypothetical protein
VTVERPARAGPVAQAEPAARAAAVLWVDSLVAQTGASAAMAAMAAAAAMVVMARGAVTEVSEATEEMPLVAPSIQRVAS